MKKGDLSEKVIGANIAYHTALSESYNEQQPHFRPENQERVNKLLRGFAEAAGDARFLDIACGTGFMLGIAERHFGHCVGVDNCEAVLDKAREAFSKEISEGKIALRLLDASETIPLESESFNVCSIHGSLHHFFKLEPVLREAYRLLKEGGIFYADQDPNYYFVKDVQAIKNPNAEHSDIVLREVNAIPAIMEAYKKDFGLDEETINLAEFQSLVKGGMKAEVVEEILKKVGFSQVSVTYRWYLGQGYVLHQLAPGLAESIDEYLRMCLPLSRNLFKYFYIVAVK